MSHVSGAEVFADVSVDPSVRGFLYRPDSPQNGFVLTHGAGSNSRAPLLVALAEAFASEGFVVLRCDLPYRQARPYGPPRPGDAVRDRQGLANAVSALKKLVPGQIFLGGHSYGGRQASMLCAEQRELVGGLLLCSYPLHPPGKPDRLRTQHLPALHVPVLFVHGTRDPFGTIEELDVARKLIPAKTALLRIDGGGHDLGFKGKARREELPGQIAAEFQKLLA
ncbi:MAG TPA: alpha/beta fold hydrolase [Terriglobales bacterium]|jgi:predicted alpha/beta-hydrolase family hydrolase|nr:alpha/beta fold hydrolase [Terriglobales bacterium]